MNVLEFTGIRRSYERGRPVLDGVDLALGAGEVVGLLGRNGAGKTTLLHIAIGLLLPEEGNVRLFGLDPVADGVAVKRRVGYVAEDQALPPYLSVRAVLDLHRSLYPTWDDGIARELLDQGRLTGRERISRLSKGQARHVAVLCAVAHRPELLLLDEPAGGFDPAARRRFLETALRLLADEGATVLFSSHHMEDVERLASRVCLLDDGRKVLDAELDALREGARLAVLPAGNGLSPEGLRALPGCVAARVVGAELRGLFVCDPAAVRSVLAGRSHEPHLRGLSLEELFIELVEARQ